MIEGVKHIHMMFAILFVLSLMIKYVLLMSNNLRALEG